MRSEARCNEVLFVEACSRSAMRRGGRGRHADEPGGRGEVSRHIRRSRRHGASAERPCRRDRRRMSLPEERNGSHPDFARDCHGQPVEAVLAERGAPPEVGPSSGAGARLRHTGLDARKH